MVAVSLINRTNAVASVQNRTYTPGPRPTWSNDGAPVDVPVRLINVSSSEAEANGLTVATMKRLLVRPGEWPGTFRSLVTIGGNVWEPIGDPEPYANSPMTAHTEINLKLVSRG